MDDGPGAGWEIERKFLVAALPPGLEGVPRRAIRQGYLALAEDGTAVRLRHADDGFFLTLKQGVGLRRREVEVALTQAQFEALWPLTEGRRLEKIRYEILHEGHTLELDRYGGALASLATVEVEFASVAESAAFAPPAWFGPEVTDDVRYSNYRLAVGGLPGG